MYKETVYSSFGILTQHSLVRAKKNEAEYPVSGPGFEP
jgi:hypothetical protein